jgi:hypothetical protein
MFIQIKQVPYMIAGIFIATLTSGFLIRLNAYTSTVEWAALLVVNRLGMGMAQQLPYTALQAVLEYVLSYLHTPPFLPFLPA